MRLKDNISLVTGASRGIGKAIALALAREGADVALNCSKSVAEAEEAAQEIKALGRRAMVVQADVADKADVNKMVKKVMDDFGRIDILVNNAGMSVVGASSELEESRWRRGIDVMLTGVFTRGFSDRLNPLKLSGSASGVRVPDLLASAVFP